MSRNSRATYRAAGLVATMLLASACAELNSIHREIAPDTGRGALIDAKQRAIIVSKDAAKHDRHPIVCAEPSPDVFSALASSAGLSADVFAKFSAALSGSLAETGATIGERTATVTLLRDLMYRFCEAYLNQAITPADYDHIIHNVTTVMTGMMALDALALRPASPIVVVGGKAEGKAKSEQTQTPGVSGAAKSAKPESSSTAESLPSVTVNNNASISAEAVKEVAAAMTRIVEEVVKATTPVALKCAEILAGASNASAGASAREYCDAVLSRARSRINKEAAGDEQVKDIPKS